MATAKKSTPSKKAASKAGPRSTKAMSAKKSPALKKTTAPFRTATASSAVQSRPSHAVPLAAVFTMLSIIFLILVMTAYS